MGKLVCPYCRTEATDAIGVKRREPRQKHYVFGMAEPYYMHSEGVPYSKKDTFKPKGGGEESPCLQPRLCRVFQHPLERALNRRAHNALAANAHGSRAKLASLTWPRPSADECSLDDLFSSALGHSFPVVLPHLMRHLLSPSLFLRHRFSYQVKSLPSVHPCAHSF